MASEENYPTSPEVSVNYNLLQIFIDPDKYTFNYNINSIMLFKVQIKRIFESIFMDQ